MKRCAEKEREGDCIKSVAPVCKDLQRYRAARNVSPKVTTSPLYTQRRTKNQSCATIGDYPGTREKVSPVTKNNSCGSGSSELGLVPNGI